MRQVIITAAIAGALVIPATADADVLVERHRDIIVGSCFSISYWYQSYSGGSRYVSAAVFRDGRRLTKWRRFYATRHWRWARLRCPDWPGRYRIKYRFGDGFTWSQAVRVGIGD